MRILKNSILGFMASAAILLFGAAPASAQFTNVTATIQDPNGIPYSNATIRAYLIPATSGQYTLQGQPYAGMAGPVTADVNGKFSMEVGDNTMITPASTQWVFVVGTGPNIPPPLGTGPQSFQTAGITISGSSQSITTQLDALAPALTNFTGGGGGGVSSVSGLSPIVVSPTTGSVQVSCPTCGLNISGTVSANHLTYASGANTVADVLNSSVSGATGAITLAAASTSATPLSITTAVTTPTAPLLLFTQGTSQTLGIYRVGPIGGNGYSITSNASGTAGFINFQDTGGISFSTVTNQIQIAQPVGTVALALSGFTSGTAKIGVADIAGNPCDILIPTGNPSAGQFVQSASAVGGRCQWTYATPSGTISGLTNGFFPKASSATTIVNSLCDESITTANAFTCTDTGGIAAIKFVAGTDNSVAGTLQLANGSAAAHNIFGSAATTTNTILGFATAPTTGDLVECITSTTTCTFTDSGVLAANVVTNSSSFTADGVLYATGNHAVAGTTAGTATFVLTSNGAGMPPTFQAATGGLTNPMTTLGDMIYENATPAAARLAGPTGQNVPYVQTSTPSGLVAQAPTWSLPGVPFDAQTGTTYTVLNTDRETLVTMSNASAIAVSLPQAGSGNFTNNFSFALPNIGAGLVTITPVTSTINGNATQIVPDNWVAYLYSDNANYRAGVFPSIAAFPSCSGGSNALTFTTATGVFGCNTISGGSSAFPLTVTGGVSGGIPYFSSTTVESASPILNTNVFMKGGGAGNPPTNSLCDEGVTVANRITCTDTAGLAAVAYTSTGTTAGFADYPQGPSSAAVAPCNTANSICDQAPTAVTAGVRTIPGVLAQGILTNAGNSSALTQGYSGDSNHSATVTTGSGTSVGSTTLCSSANCPAGTYMVSVYLDVTTACGTSGTYIVNLIYTDDQGSKTVVANINGTGSVPATGTLTTTSTANYGENSQVIRLASGNLNYSTTAGACGTAGPMVGKLYLAAVPVM